MIDKCPPHKWELTSTYLQCQNCLYEYKLRQHHWSVLRLIQSGINKTRLIAKALNWTDNRAYTILCGLYTYGLLYRQRDTNNTFRWYIVA